MGLLARRNYNPINPIFGDRLFEDFFNDPWGLSLARPTQSNIGRCPIRRLKTEDGTFKMEFDVPGAGKDDIEIHYDEESGVLSVSSKIDESDEGKETSRTFSYQVTAYDLDAETVEATCDKGILTIIGSPVVKQPTRKRIEIK